MFHKYGILFGVIITHILVLYIVRNLVIFESPSLAPDSSSAFSGVSVELVKRVSTRSEEMEKSPTPSTAPSFNLIKLSQYTPTISIQVPSSPTAFTLAPIVPKSLPLNLPTNISSGETAPAGIGTDRNQVGLSAGTSNLVNLFGMDVSSEDPVIAFLDTSDSLTAIRDSVKTEIKKLLPTCQIIEVDGVVFSTKATLERLKQSSKLSDYFADYYLSLVDSSIIPTITSQIKSKQITGPLSIYYFSDFEDYADPSDVADFTQLLKDNKIRFYAYSVGKEPSRSIRQMCTDTGGSWKQKATGDK